MTRLFGTDGVRGIANRELTPELALALGLAAADVLAPGGRFLVGRDTRGSGPMLEMALAAGLTAGGADVELLGVITTPGLAYLVANTGASAGAMISASHNPAHYNGIKFFDGRGEKLHEDTEDAIAALVPGQTARRAPPDRPGRVCTRGGLVEEYLARLAACPDPRPDGLRAVIDCAHGSASALAPTVMERVGVSAHAVNARPDGRNINLSCGSLHPGALSEMVTGRGADLGLAFDGDADRVVAVDNLGHLIDGDHIMAICGLDLLSREQLPGKAVVATVMSNLGLELCLARAGGRLIRTAVGDRHVQAEMTRLGAALGGEQSGHILFPRLASTGDGILTALQLMSVMVRTGRTLSELGRCMQVMPQVLLNVPVARPDGWDADRGVRSAIRQAEQALGKNGRVLVRPSGTEPVIRIMVEGPGHERLDDLAAAIAGAITGAVGATGGESEADTSHQGCGQEG